VRDVPDTDLVLIEGQHVGGIHNHNPVNAVGNLMIPYFDEKALQGIEPDVEKKVKPSRQFMAVIKKELDLFYPRKLPEYTGRHNAELFNCLTTIVLSHGRTFASGS